MFRAHIKIIVQLFNEFVRFIHVTGFLVVVD